MTMTHQLQTPVRYQPRRDLVSSASSSDTDTRWASRTPAIIVVAVIIIAAAIGFAGDAAASAPPTADSIEIYVVQPGDTLWEIAGSIAVEGEDLRPLVDALQEVTGGSNLEIGQQIVIDHALIRS